MKKLLVSVCVCILCVMLPVMALAMSQTEWNQQCRMKTTGAVTLYSTQKSDSSTGELATGTDIDMWVSGSLPAGTYIKSYDYDAQLDMREIGYYSNGGEARAFIRSNAITAAVKIVKIDDGSSIDVPEALMDDIPALLKYLASEMPGYTFSQVEGSSVIHKEKASASDEGGYGSWKSLRERAQEAAAKLGLENPEDLPAALVYAPRTGKASLRDRAAGNGKVIEKLLDGTIVFIVEKGASFSRVYYDGMTGFIINSALEILDPEQRPIGTGMLTYNGKVIKGSNINVRSDGTGKGRKIVEWPTGTEVLVWSLSDNENWYEIEYDGLRVYVQAKFLTITEYFEYDDEETAEAEDTVPAEAEEAPEEGPTDGELNG